MPSGYAHYRFGAQMLSHLPESGKAAVEKFRKLYDLGTHGPDVFFFYRPVVKNPVVALGKTLHLAPGRELFAAVAEQLRRKPREEGQTYVWGLLTHYALDSVCHPYIKQARDRGIAGHIEMETEFDRLLLERDGQLAPKPHFGTGYMNLTSEESQLLAQLYAGITPGQLREAVLSMGVLNRGFWHKPGVKYRIAKKVMGKDFSQFLMTPQANPRCRETNEKLLALYSKAQGRFDSLCQSWQRSLQTGSPLGKEFDLAFDLT